MNTALINTLLSLPDSVQATLQARTDDESQRSLLQMFDWFVITYGCTLGKDRKTN
jgi:hypothetical protein